MYYTTKVVKILDITTNVVYNTITTNVVQIKKEDKFMKKPIFELYYGRFCAMENIRACTKEYERHLDKLENADTKLRGLIEKDETLFGLYKTAMDALEGVCSEEMACNYREAFRAGVLLGMDIMGAFDEAE